MITKSELQAKIASNKKTLQSLQAKKNKLEEALGNTTKSVTELPEEAPDFGEKLEGFRGVIKNTKLSIDSLDAMIEEAENTLKSLIHKFDLVDTPDMPAYLPTGGASPNSAKTEDDVVKSFFLSRHGIGTAKNELGGYDFSAKPFRDVYDGKDFRQLNLEMERAFKSFIGNSGRGITRDDTRLLRNDYLPPHIVLGMMETGLYARDIKSIQVAGIDTLGGFAIPPMRNQEILRQSRGLTAVIKAGATVLQVSNNNTIEWLNMLNAGDPSYSSTLRGEYVSETGRGSEQVLRFGKVKIEVTTYNFRINISTLLQSSVLNFDAIINAEIASTRAIDHDRAYLIGNGINKPLGILPNGENPPIGTQGHINEIPSGSATKLLYSGIRKLRHGINPQYRKGNMSLVGNDLSNEAIEDMTDGISRPIITDALEEGMKVPGVGARWYGSESLDDPVAGNKPLILGDFSGYAVVEGSGLRIAQWQDSGTGATQMQYEILERHGGGVIKPWLFAVQSIEE